MEELRELVQSVEVLLVDDDPDAVEIYPSARMVRQMEARAEQLEREERMARETPEEREAREEEERAERERELAELERERAEMEMERYRERVRRATALANMVAAMEARAFPNGGQGGGGGGDQSSVPRRTAAAHGRRRQRRSRGGGGGSSSGLTEGGGDSVAGGASLPRDVDELSNENVGLHDVHKQIMFITVMQIVHLFFLDWSITTMGVRVVVQLTLVTFEFSKQVYNGREAEFADHWLAMRKEDYMVYILWCDALLAFYHMRLPATSPWVLVLNFIGNDPGVAASKACLYANDAILTCLHVAFATVEVTSLLGGVTRRGRGINAIIELGPLSANSRPLSRANRVANMV